MLVVNWHNSSPHSLLLDLDRLFYRSDLRRYDHPKNDILDPRAREPSVTMAWVYLEAYRTHCRIKFININQYGSSFSITLWLLCENQTWRVDVTMDANQFQDLTLKIIFQVFHQNSLLSTWKSLMLFASCWTKVTTLLILRPQHGWLRLTWRTRFF